MIVIETIEQDRAPRVLFARRNQDRHVMIEIASPATLQLSSLLLPRRRRSPNDAPGASRVHGRREKYDPIAAREHFEIIFDSHSDRSTTDASDSQIPIGRSGGDALPTRCFLLWRFSNAGLLSRTAMVNEGPASENLHSSGRHAKAWLMSAIRSSGCSIPIDMRTNDGVIPISRRACSVSPECTVVVGWQIKDSVPPRLTANLNT